MFNNYKAGMVRLLKNIYFIGGCLIAFFVTFLFSSGNYTLPFLAKYPLIESTVFVSAAITLYFSAFTPLFMASEYTDGFIRNRIINGYSQKEIYFAMLLCMESALFIMTLVYLVGGGLGLLIAGESMTSEALSRILIYIIAVFGYVALMTTVSFRITKLLGSVITCVVIFNMTFNLVLFGNALVAFSSGTVFKVARIVYNINVLGQWFIATGLADLEANPGTASQIVISVCVFAVSVLAGIFGLSKRDLKN